MTLDPGWAEQGWTRLDYSRGKADGFDEIIVLHRSGEFQQHDVVDSQADGSLSIVRVNFYLSHGDILTVNRLIDIASHCLTSLHTDLMRS